MMKNSALIQALKKHKKFLITTHVNPDADAAASALAVAFVLRSMGKTVTVVNQDAIPSWLQFLPKASIFKKAGNLKSVDYDVAVALDCGDFSRVGDVRDLLKEGKPLINIDHHKTNKGFGDLNLVVPGSSSTAEVLYDVFCAMNVRWTKELATLIYAGIMTDTGSFRYDCTSPETHRIAGELVALGVSPSDVYTQIYDVIPMKDLKLFLGIVNGVEFLKDGKVACFELRRSVLKRFSDGFDVRDKIFGMLRSTKGVEVIAIFNEISARQTRVNFRSKGSFDVAELASKFNGGGHAKASGCTVDYGMPETRRKILREIIKGI